MKKMRVKLLHLENDFEAQGWEEDKSGWIKIILSGDKVEDKEIRYFLIRESEILWVDITE